MTTNAAETVPDIGPLLRAADQRLIRSVDALSDAAWAEPSGLPNWSRAHVVAHLILNAEAVAGCLEEAVAGRRVPMYDSPAARDAEINQLAEDPPVDLRERLMGSTTRVAAALSAVAQLAFDETAGALSSAPEGSGSAPVPIGSDRALPTTTSRDLTSASLVPAVGTLLGTVLEQYPSGRRFTLGAVPAMRLREVEIHHVDLDVGYASEEWDAWLVGHLVETMAARAGIGELVLAPDDDPRRWTLSGEAGGAQGGGDSGDGGPVEISGPLHAIAWWLTGRPGGDALRASGGALPLLPPW